MFSKFSARVPRWCLTGMFLLTFNYVVTHIFTEWPYLFAFPSMMTSVTDFFKLLVCSSITDELITLVFTLFALFIFERLIFGCWSKLETVFFLFLIMTLPTLLSALMLRLIYPENVMLYGGSAFVASVTVLAAQLDADRFLFGYGKYGLKSKLGFCCGFLLFSVLSFIRFVNWANVLLFTSGFLCSWLYLRFFQHHTQRRYGDHRPGFAFAKFFPGPLEEWVAGPTNMIYQLLLRIKLFKSLERKSEIVSTASFAVNIPGLTTESDRHRRIALNALNEQLFKAPSTVSAQNSAMEWPRVDDQTESTSGATPATDTVAPNLLTASESIAAGNKNTRHTQPSVSTTLSDSQEVVVVHVGTDETPLARDLPGQRTAK